MEGHEGGGASAPEQISKEAYVIRMAIGSIRDGLFEINEQLLNVRGVLSKEEVLKLHMRLKEMRDTAERAEDAFRDWTVELTGQVFVEKERVMHGDLRREFEVQVAAVQTCMTRVANEVARRKAHKKSGKEDAANAEKSSSSTSSAAAEEASPQKAMDAKSVKPASALEKSASGAIGSLTAVFELDSLKATAAGTIESLKATAARAEAQLAPTPDESSVVKNAGPKTVGADEKKAGSTWGPGHSGMATAATPSRSLPKTSQATKLFQQTQQSHASIASVLKKMESNEQELVSDVEIVASGQNGKRGLSKGKKLEIRERINRLRVNPMFKYLLGACMCVVGFMVYNHARFLILQEELPKASEDSARAKSYRQGLLSGEVPKKQRAQIR